MMLKKLSLYAVAIVGVITILSSCEKEYEPIESIDDAKLTQYITSKNLQVTKDPSGFYYEIVNPGVGEKTYDRLDSVLYNFEIKSLDGKSYYNTTMDAANIATVVGFSDKIILSKSIPGIRTSIMALKPGGTANVLVPSYLAFGKNGETKLNVPSNESLLIEVKTLPETSQAVRDENLIKAFVQRNNLNATRDGSGVYYVIEKAGNGQEINAASTLYPFYTGRVMDGEEFQTSKDTSATLAFRGTIPGWQRVLPNIKEGGKMRMIIPSGLAYGSAGSGNSTVIKMNSILDFDVEIWKVKN
jgi:FKBP-type peptidyl-prolyl cis-trans isomerase FkpA